MKKITFISIIFILFIIFISIISFQVSNSDKKITNIINKNTLNKVAQIECSNGNIIDRNQMISNLKQCSFKKYNGKLGNTTHLTYVFMDNNKNILFKYIDIGNRNIVGFSTNNKITYYIKY